MNKPSNPKERGLLKGAIRRVFSRSDLRREALLKNTIIHNDPERPRVTKWSFCTECGTIEANYLMQVDHIQPVIPINKSLEELDWNTVVDRQWCELDNLQVVCKDCHKIKTKLENKERRRLKRERNEKI